MTPEQFVQSRHYLGKTQAQLAELLSVSTKAVQSFEQAWRNVPVGVERQLMFLLYSSQISPVAQKMSCWETMQCPDERKKQCIAWEYGLGQLCWFITGTLCHGEPQHSWINKMELCKKCNFLRAVMPQYFKLISCFLICLSVVGFYS
jgi:hypothetical protein